MVGRKRTFKLFRGEVLEDSGAGCREGGRDCLVHAPNPLLQILGPVHDDGFVANR